MSAIPDPATTDWVPLNGAGIGVPQPVVNGQWVKGVGGAPVWSAIAQADLPTNLGASEPAVTDCNTVVASGWYWAPYSGCTNWPYQHYWHLRVLAQGGNVKQIAYRYDSLYNEAWTRMSTNGGGSWSAWVPISGPFAAAPPNFPGNGDIWFCNAGANGETWQFRYNANSSSAYKWEYVGGPPLLQSGLTQEPSGGGSPVFVAGTGFGMPRPGDYIFEWGGWLGDDGGWNHIYLGLYDLGAGANVVNISKYTYLSAAAGTGVDLASKRRINGIAQGRNYALTVFNSNGQANAGIVQNAWFSVTPVRVS